MTVYLLVYLPSLTLIISAGAIDCLIDLIYQLDLRINLLILSFQILLLGVLQANGLITGINKVNVTRSQLKTYQSQFLLNGFNFVL